MIVYKTTKIYFVTKELNVKKIGITKYVQSEK